MEGRGRREENRKETREEEVGLTPPCTGGRGGGRGCGRPHQREKVSLKASSSAFMLEEMCVVPPPALLLPGAPCGGEQLLNFLPKKRRGKNGGKGKKFCLAVPLHSPFLARASFQDFPVQEEEYKDKSSALSLRRVSDFGPTTLQ